MESEIKVIPRDDGKKIYIACAITFLVTAVVVGVGEYLGLAYLNGQSAKAEADKVRNELQVRISALEAERNALLEANKEEAVVTESTGDSQVKTEKAVGLIKKVYEKSDKLYIDIDYIQWLTGDTAVKAASEDTGCVAAECVPNGFYIRNTNPQLRTIEVAKNAGIGILMSGSSVETKATFNQFRALFDDDSTSNSMWLTPFNIELRDGVIARISQQYMP